MKKVLLNSNPYTQLIEHLLNSLQNQISVWMNYELILLIPLICKTKRKSSIILLQSSNHINKYSLRGNYICIMQLQSVRNFLVIYRPRAKSSKIFINTNNTILNLLSNLYLLFARIRILFYFVCESSWTMTKAHQHQLRKWLCLLLHILILLLLKFYNIVIIYWRYILIR